MQELTTAAKGYISLLVAGAVVILSFLLARGDALAGDQLVLAIAIAGLQTLANLFPLGYGSQTKLMLHTGVVFAAVLLFDPGVAMAAVGSGTLLAYGLRRQDLPETAFNTAHTMLQVGLGGGILAIAGWRIETFGPGSPWSFVSVLLAAVVVYVTDLTSVATIVRLQTGTPLRTTWRDMATANGVETLAQLALGVLTALTAHAYAWALPLLLFPAAAVYRSSGRHRAVAHQASHDDLTGLPNRALVIDRLERALAHAARHQETIALLFVDVDNLKFVNDSLGHHAGDDLLIAVAERIRERVRADDLVARLGGDEFAVLLEDVRDASGAARVADRVIAGFRLPFTVGGWETRSSVSVGIALSSGGGCTASELLRDADAAMYRAKSTGKSRYEVYDARMGREASERLRLEADLRGAVEREEFELYYQPEIELGTGRTIGMEALLRWRHSARGVVSPAEFIPLAEDMGLIVPLGRWILAEACRQVAQWRRDEPEDERIAVSVNISAIQFRHPGLPEDVARVLADTGLPASCLHLEITESVMMDDVASNLQTLQRLRDLGVRLAMDDFGTGYSSMSYLKRFPLDYLKIDRTFITDLGTSDADEAIVGNIIGLARALGMEVIAEGVERPDQVAQLRGLGCRLAQGFLFSKPLPAPEATAYLARPCRAVVA